MGCIINKCAVIDVNEGKHIEPDKTKEILHVDQIREPIVEDPNHIQELLNKTIENTPVLTYKFNKAKVIKVYDGDTVTIAAWHDGGIYQFNVRIFGIDCDEINGGTERTKFNAQLAKKMVSNMCLNKIVDIEVLNGTVLHGKKMTEKFGRLLSNISIDGKSIAGELLSVGLARIYDGKTKSTDPLNPKIEFVEEKHI